MVTKRKKKTTRVTMKPRKRGQKKVTFEEGGLHKSLGVPMGMKIPESKMQEAMRGEHGMKAKRQAMMAEHMLAKGRKTSAKRRKKRNNARG